MEKKLDYVTKLANEINCVDSSLFELHNIKQGLRNKDKTGVLIGLTKIGNVVVVVVIVVVVVVVVVF